MELTLNKPSVLTIQLTSTGGSPVTGKDHTGVSVFLKKAIGFLPEEKVLDSSNFVEVDATNMPGVYELTLDANDTGKVGFLVIVVKPSSGSSDFDQVLLGYTVRPKDVDDRGVPVTQQEGETQVFVATKGGGSNTYTVKVLDILGQPVIGLEDPRISQKVFVDGELVPAGQVQDWEAADGDDEGYYKFSLPPAIVGEAESDILLRFKNETPIWESLGIDTDSSSAETAKTLIYDPDDGTYKLKKYGIFGAYNSDYGIYETSDFKTWEHDPSFTYGYSKIKAVDAVFDGTQLIKAAVDDDTPSFYVKKGSNPWQKMGAGGYFSRVKVSILDQNNIIILADNNIRRYNGSSVTTLFSQSQIAPGKIVNYVKFIGGELWVAADGGTIKKCPDVAASPAVLEDISYRFEDWTSDTKILYISNPSPTGDMLVAGNNNSLWESHDFGKSFRKVKIPTHVVMSDTGIAYFHFNTAEHVFSGKNDNDVYPLTITAGYTSSATGGNRIIHRDVTGRWTMDYSPLDSGDSSTYFSAATNHGVVLGKNANGIEGWARQQEFRFDARFSVKSAGGGGGGGSVVQAPPAPISFAGTILRGAASTSVTVKVEKDGQPATGLTASDVDIRTICNGVPAITTVPQSFTEIDPVDSPGFYTLTFDQESVPAGEVVVWIKPFEDEALLFEPDYTSSPWGGGGGDPLPGGGGKEGGVVFG